MSLHQSIWGRALLRPHFLIISVLLLAGSLSWPAVLRSLHQVMSKAPVPLLRPLDEMPEAFGSRFVLAREMHLPAQDVDHGKYHMPEDVEETLGTKDTISWFFKDNQKSSGDSFTFVRLHIAYYPLMLDGVPHVPNVCMLAGGWDLDPNDPAHLVNWPAGDVPPQWQEHWRQTPVLRSAFARIGRGGTMRSVVFHVFSVNGEPMQDRVAVVATLSNPTKKYCYYAKIELSADSTAGALTGAQADQECEAFWACAAPEILRFFPSAADLKQREAER